VPLQLIQWPRPLLLDEMMPTADVGNTFKAYKYTEWCLCENKMLAEPSILTSLFFLVVDPPHLHLVGSTHNKAFN